MHLHADASVHKVDRHLAAVAIAVATTAIVAAFQGRLQGFMVRTVPVL